MNGDWFVGRNGELAQLRNLVTAVAAGSGGVVVLEGEQGIGKSALLRTGLAGAAGAGCRVLWGTADELLQPFPLRLMTECLEEEWLAAVGTGRGQAAGAAPAQVPGPAETVVTLSGDPVLAGAERLLAQVDRLCAVSPVVLVAEDLQWSDEASLLVWHRLSRAVGQLPLLLAGSWRPGTRREDLARLRAGVVSRGGLGIVLDALPDPEVADLVARLVGGRPGPRLSRLVGRAGGNPLYARELVDGLLREDRIRIQGGAGELADELAVVPVPVSLAAAIAGRLAGLAEDVVWVLRWAAVLGSEFSVADLEVVTGRTAGELMEVIEAAFAAGVLTDGGPLLRFRHGLIRQVLHEGMPTALRTALHLQAARELAEAGSAPERVAAQLVSTQGEEGSGEAETLTADLAKSWAAEWLAGSAAVLSHRAPQVAAGLLRDLLARLADDDPRREALEASLATVAFLLMRNEEAEQVGGALLRSSADPVRAAEMAWVVAYTQLRTGRPAEAETTIEAALDRPELGEGHAAELQALHAVILTTIGDVDQAARVAGVALGAAEQAGSRLAAGYALHALGGVSFLRRDHAATLDYTGRVLATVGDDPLAAGLRLLALGSRSAALSDLDRQAESLAAARQGLVLGEQSGTPRLAKIRGFLAHAYFETGQWDDALAELEPVADVPAPAHFLVTVHGLSALIAVHRDDRDAADQHLRATRDLVIDPATRANAHFLLLARALIAEQDTHPAAGAAVLAPCLQPGVAEAMPSLFLLLPTLVRLALAAGETATALAAADAAEREAAREPLPVKAAAAGCCRGLVAGDPAPVLAAASYYERTGRPCEHASALEEAAVLAAARGDRPAAREALNAALSLYHGLSARRDIRRARARLRPFGLRTGRPGGYPARPATGWGALTPTELKIAYSVAAGRSNPDIAAGLFLSRNTVQTHVSHILAKLGARSRAEIVREALQHPEESAAGSR